MHWFDRVTSGSDLITPRGTEFKCILLQSVSVYGYVLFLVVRVNEANRETITNYYTKSDQCRAH